MLKLKTCPTCGRKNLKWVVRDWSDTYRGKAYVVPMLGFHECPDCGERLYDHDAMQKIEQYSPAYAKGGRRRRSSRKPHARASRKAVRSHASR